MSKVIPSPAAVEYPDPATGERLLSHREQDAARLAAESLAEQEAAARRAAEARVAELEALLARIAACPAAGKETARNPPAFAWRRPVPPPGRRRR